MKVSIDDLTTAHAWLQSLRPLPSDVTAELRHRFEVALTHHSTAIEGNTLTQSETQIVLEKGVTIGGKSVLEHLEVIGHKEALDFVFELADLDRPFDSRTIRELHGLVTRGQPGSDSGAFRTLDVKAAGTEFVYPSHLKVPELMTEFLEWLNAPGDLHPVQIALEAHLRFVTIHPFRDGNGRVGRLLMNLVLIRMGYPLAIIRLSDRSAYIASLEKAQTYGDPSDIQNLVQAAVARSLRDVLETALSSSQVVPNWDRSTALQWLRERSW